MLDALLPAVDAMEQACAQTQDVVQVLAAAYQDGLLKVRLALTAVADGEFSGGGAIQTVQQLRVGPKHGFLEV